MLLPALVRTNSIMSSFPTDSPFTGTLPYHLASRLCQAQAQKHTQSVLWERFPTLTEENWNRIFAERRPLLWVDEHLNTVSVAEEALSHLVSWAVIYEASLNSEPTQLEFEGHYLAKQLAYYCNLANELVAADPTLTHPNSIVTMRAVFQRLCVGNDVAERLSEPFARVV
jgi:hypothetical protein